MMVPAGRGRGHPSASTAYSMSTLPAFSNSSVPLTFWPFCGCFKPMSITCSDPGLSDRLAGLDLEAAFHQSHLGDALLHGHAVTSNCPATAAEPPTRRSGALPLLLMLI